MSCRTDAKDCSNLPPIPIFWYQVLMMTHIRFWLKDLLHSPIDFWLVFYAFAPTAHQHHQTMYDFYLLLVILRQSPLCLFMFIQRVCSVNYDSEFDCDCVSLSMWVRLHSAVYNRDFLILFLGRWESSSCSNSLPLFSVAILVLAISEFFRKAFLTLTDSVISWMRPWYIKII